MNAYIVEKRIFLCILVNCPVEGLEPDDANGTRGATDLSTRSFNCDGTNSMGSLKIVHTNVNDFNVQTIILPEEDDPKRVEFPNLRRGHPILKENVISHVEAFGDCICWELYNNKKFVPKKSMQLISSGGKIKLEISPGSLKKVACPKDDYYDDYD